ncbi:MAG: cytochrome C [Gallionellaceae bacterium]|nr:cytochrome C [Gallionellaceae bacterium]
MDTAFVPTLLRCQRREIMPTQSIVLTAFMVPLLAVLYGCQPEESSQQPATGNAATPTVSSAEAMKLAKEIGCLACHSIDKKLLGPAWKQAAARYRYDTAAEAMLMNKIAKCGSGAWGSIAMPAYPGLSEAKYRVLVRFILSLE